MTINYGGDGSGWSADQMRADGLSEEPAQQGSGVGALATLALGAALVASALPGGTAYAETGDGDRTVTSKGQVVYGLQDAMDASSIVEIVPSANGSGTFVAEQFWNTGDYRGPESVSAAELQAAVDQTAAGGRGGVADHGTQGGGDNTAVDVASFDRP